MGSFWCPPSATLRRPPTLNLHGPAAMPSIALPLPHPGADTVNAILADPGQPLGGIVPPLRQGEHEGEKALRFQRERLVPQVMVGHHRVIADFLNAEYRHVGYLLPSVLKSVRFGGFAPLYRRPQAKNKGISHPFSYSFACPRQGIKKRHRFVLPMALPRQMAGLYSVIWSRGGGPD